MLDYSLVHTMQKEISLLAYLSSLLFFNNNNIRTKGMMTMTMMMMMMTTMIRRDDNDTGLIQLPMFIRIVIQNS